MLAEVGYLSTLLAFLAAGYAIVSSLAGVYRRQDRLIASARNATFATFPLMAIGAGALLVALITEEYQIAYVWNVTNPATPVFYRVTALWGGQAGSMLFWSLLMSGCAASLVAVNWQRNRRLMPYVIATLMIVLAAFLGLSLFLENPFERWWIMPNDDVVRAVFAPAGAVPPALVRLADTANGLNPLLRHFGMAIHPPMLYLGFVGFIIPFAFAMAALASGDLSTGWIRATRRWALAAWIFLGLGLVLGGRWAYDVLGWGGYWGWDPVENAAFLPWLLGTAFLHSVMIQEKRGMLKVWNLFLVIGTFSAVIFGTFATRSGLVDSVHSFARSPIGFPLFFMWFILSFASVSLILWRWRRGELKDERPFAGILSRETLFVLNNIVFVLLFVFIFWGSFGAPVLSELLLNTDITLGKDYFMSVTPPLFLALFILMGVAPLSAWGITSLRKLGAGLVVPTVMTVLFLALVVVFSPATPPALIGYGFVALSGFVAIWETVRGVRARVKSQHESPLQALSALFARNRRRYGGYVIHLGVVVIGIGVIGSTLFQQETQQTLTVGQSLTLGDYTMSYDGFQGGQIAEDGRVMDIAQVTVRRAGQSVASLRPRRDFYPNTEGMNTMTIAGAHSTVENDFYVLLVGWEQANASSATFKVYLNPLINLVWWGSLVLILGTVIAMWPNEPALVGATQAAKREARLGAGAKA